MKCPECSTPDYYLPCYGEGECSNPNCGLYSAKHGKAMGGSPKPVEAKDTSQPNPHLKKMAEKYHRSKALSSFDSDLDLAVFEAFKSSLVDAMFTNSHLRTMAGGFRRGDSSHTPEQFFYRYEELYFWADRKMCRGRLNCTDRKFNRTRPDCIVCHKALEQKIINRTNADWKPHGPLPYKEKP